MFYNKQYKLKDTCEIITFHIDETRIENYKILDLNFAPYNRKQYEFSSKSCFAHKNHSVRHFDFVILFNIISISKSFRI